MGVIHLREEHTAILFMLGGEARDRKILDVGSAWQRCVL